jgi:hypothetical protein
MANIDREIQELLADYAVALRDGCLPGFLKSLSRDEAKCIKGSEKFWEATEVVRLMNSAGFGEKVVAPDVGLFISRVDAAIVSRQKKSAGVNANSQSQSRKSIADLQWN